MHELLEIHDDVIIIFKNLKMKYGSQQKVRKQVVYNLS